MNCQDNQNVAIATEIRHQDASKFLDDRIAGYLSALCDHNLSMSRKRMFRGGPRRCLVCEGGCAKKIDAIMGANDYIATMLIRTLINIGVSIPEDIKSRAWTMSGMQV